MQKHAAMDLFRKNVKRICQLRGWTQRRLADELGMAESNLSRALRGSHSPSIDFAERVANALEVEVRDLFLPISEKNEKELATAS